MVEADATEAPISEGLRSIIDSCTDVFLRPLTQSNTIYELGINSFTVLHLAAQIKAKTGICLSAADILEKPRLRDLEALIRHDSRTPVTSTPWFDFDRFEKTNKPSVSREMGVAASDIEAIYPCTPLQQGILAQSMYSTGRYISTMAYKMNSQYDDVSVSLLRSAWYRVVQRHPILRSVFVPIDDLNFPFAMVMLQRIEIDSHILLCQDVPDLEHARRGFADLHQSWHKQPAWQVKLATSEDGTFMTVIMHHALFDAHCYGMIMCELDNELNHRKSFISPAPLKPVLNQIIASASPESIEGRHSANEHGAQFWKTALKDASTSRFPCLDPVRSTTRETDWMSISLSMSLPEVEEACRRDGITLQALGQASWATLLSAYTGDANVTFGTVLSGRDVHQVRDIISPKMWSQ